MPLALLLGPIQELGDVQSAVHAIRDRGEYAEVMNLTCLNEVSAQAFRVVGPRFVPKAISSSSGGIKAMQEVHNLDVTNVYTMDREWRCGSCPHLFVLNRDKELNYVGELLSQGEQKMVTERIRLPKDSVRVLIVELEDEMSMISHLSIDGEVVCRDLELHRGQSIEFVAENPIELEVTGGYFPFFAQLNNDGGVMRNRLVCNFIWNWKAKQSSMKDMDETTLVRATL